MIGVLCSESEVVVVAEFFELFKTPWEIYNPGKRYEVLICSGGQDFREDAAKLIIMYNGRRIAFDEESKLPISTVSNCAAVLSFKGKRLPIYGDHVAFNTGPGVDPGIEGRPNSSVLHLLQLERSLVARIGFDLFAEVERLLTEGQPLRNAHIPTLDLHISLLRTLMLEQGVEFIEIPPVPEGYQFIACLTHDVDHPKIRLHKFDHTMVGFLYRAFISSAVSFLRRRISFAELVKNLIAVVKLPFVYIGWAKDFWYGFDRYIALENGAPSSFFIIPFSNVPGENASGPAPAHRASAYGIADIADKIPTLQAAGCEIGLHGIDAWKDSSKAAKEVDEVRRIAGEFGGVRMHWLYFDQKSHQVLEEAGADYDSTVGYNESIGFRAGTAQVYRPLRVTRLLELPLHIMDTALFYPAYLNLSKSEARTKISEVLDHASDNGGAITINWHDRSIAPERLWSDCYTEMVKDIEARRGWFATASDAVLWFRNRRSVKFTRGPSGDTAYAEDTDRSASLLPRMIVKKYHQGKVSPSIHAGCIA